MSSNSAVIRFGFKDHKEIMDAKADLVITEADANSLSEDVTPHTHGISTSSEEEEEVPAKVPRLLAKYSRHRHRSGGPSQEDTTRRQLVKYLQVVSESQSILSALQFWQDMAKKLPTLYKLACKVLSVPASSAPVERIFSRGGIIMRPHRARLSAEMLSMLMFLKCNEDIL
ncbi:uncharacterized protein LOC119732280 [Patiria miniata]|uniref:HAT C-terminal dimerisation domain-containing protein n=1 Tax=Patiria miniata TaxID=46514 RepID=A0A914ADV3_PATMI|nr:uncharacterized protein LOC119732280 [Patiria miniata]